MSDIAIKAENIGKAYQLGEISTGTISRDLERWWAKARGKEDPFLTVGETNDRTKKGSSNMVWSLKDVSFEINQGDAVGIIGRNGAGKSTLLKVLSKVTSPTTGSIKGKGRIASLLEVGTGFHPELTGRENIFLNGAILGMRKAEIKKQFDSIVDFAGVERYIDTPVKRYSSGMYVRLAFAVAAHLESEILIVDEVLAVGDAEFQKKCLGKMGEVSKGEGRTVLFVSHNMAAVKQLCNKGIVLKNGQKEFEGTESEAINLYQAMGEMQDKYIHEGSIEQAIGNSNIRILKFQVYPDTGDIISIITATIFELVFFNLNPDINLAVTFELRNLDETIVFHQGTWVCENHDAKKGIYSIKGTLPSNLLNASTYKFSLIIAENIHTVLLKQNDIIQFEILNETKDGIIYTTPGIIKPKINYEIDYKGNDV